jgi:hypothetical protein
MPMVRGSLILAGALMCVVWCASAQEHMQLGAHVHGHGRLNIAIEDKTIAVEPEVPGADIVGFEHEPAAPEEKAALEGAKAKLAGGAALFRWPEGAQCALKDAKVSAEAEHAEEHHHSEFHVEYAFECASPSQATSLGFDYFKAFPNARELEVSVISPKGQNSFEVARERPSLDLKGVM